MPTTSEGLRQLYEEHDAELYASFPALVNGLREHIDRIYKVCSLVQVLAPASLLDIGCNRGLFGSLVRLNGGPVKRVVGVDISRLSCAYAKEQMGYDETHQLDASAPFNLSEQFDLVLCMELLEHVPQPAAVIRNVAHHLKPGALALFSCPEERGELDGQIHVRRVTASELSHWVELENLQLRQTFFLPSLFCEKPKWQGWNFVLASKRAQEECEK